MASCAEAAHYFFECGVSKLDGSPGGPKNGIPCETLCVQRSSESDAEKMKDMCDRIKRAPMFMSEGRLSIGSVPSACTKQ
jgi:hypothetical protein